MSSDSFVGTAIQIAEISRGETKGISQCCQASDITVPGTYKAGKGSHSEVMVRERAWDTGLRICFIEVTD